MKLTKEQREQNKKDIIRLLESTERDDIGSLIGWLSTSDFFKAPASTRHHGNYEGGLAYHSLMVQRAFERRLDDLYIRHIPDAEVVIAGLMHDVCKVGLYYPNKLKSGAISEAKPYVIDDMLPVGHGEKSVIMVQRHIQLTPRETVLIRWHMGNYDPAYEMHREKVEEMFPEVIALQHADKEVTLIYDV